MAMSEAARAAKAAYNRKWKQENPEKVKASKRKWQKEHPEKQREYSERYWEKKAAEQAAGQSPS